MKRIVTCVTLTVMCMIMLMLAGCSDGVVGYWIVDEITAGDVVMDQDDAKNIGLPLAGSLKLQKSGACEVNLLGDEYEGSWAQSSDGTITVSYGDGLTLTGSVDDEGVMNLVDGQETGYKLSK